MRDLTTREDADTMLREPEVVLLKHGAHCPISAAARKELDAFAHRHPQATICRVEVTGQRELSDYLADQLGVPHESPQAFVLREGKPVWRAAHFDISAQGIARELGQ